MYIVSRNLVANIINREDYVTINIQSYRSGWYEKIY